MEKVKSFWEEGKNATVEFENAQGDIFSPLKYTKMHGNTDLVKLIIESGA